MATINKQYSFIWYGKCIDTDQVGGGCTSFDLTSGTESAKIDTVWQVNDGGIAKSWVSGATDNSFSTLECGHSYYIKLNDAGSYNCAITHATLSAYGEDGTSSAFRITEDCNAGGGGGGTVLQASIALGACQSPITLSATQLDSDDSYTSCQLQKTGATFVAISDTINNIQYNLTTGGLLSYRIADTTEVATDLSTGAITITANADEGYGFGTQSNELTVTINGSVTALPKPVINITPTVSSTNTVTFIPDFNDATNWGGTKWKYRLKNAIGQPITDYTTVTNFQSSAIDITNDFDHAGTYTIDAEIVTIGGDSIAGSTKVEDQTINIPRLEANISVGNIAHGTIDRDALPDTKTASVTATNISGDWAIHTNAETAAISASQNNNNLQSVLNTQELGVIDSDNKVTISAQGTKWNQAYSVNINELVLGPASNEVTAECTITATVTDGVVFTSSTSSVNDNTRDTDDSIPTPTKITITHDDVDSWVASLSPASTNWKFSTTQDGTYNNDPTTILSKSGLDHAPGTFDFWVKYDTDSVADETLTLTLTESATDGHPDVADIQITLTGQVTQAIGEATFSGCTSIDAISIEIGSPSDSTNNNKTCDLTTTDCSVADKTATTLGIFTYTITSNEVNYWITDASSVQSTNTETLAITATADTNFAFGGSSTKIINVTLSGTVEAATILENSSIANGACPNDISQDASTTATQTSCQLTLVNAVCVPITNAVHGGLKYSLTAQGLLTYEANDPESVGEHSHEVTITANSDDPSASLFTGQAQTVTHKVTMKITVNEVVVADDLLWVGFQDGSNTHYTNWYELEETQAVPIGDAIDVTTAVGSWNGVIWNNVLVPQNVPNVEKILPDNDGTITFEKIKHSCVHPLSATTTLFGVLTANSTTIGGFTYTTSDELLNAMDGNVQIKRTTIPADFIETFETVIKYELIGTIAPPYTTFSISSNDSAYSSEIGTLMNTNNVPYLQGVNITASPTRPSGTLSATQQTKTFNSDLLNVFCNGCPPISGTETAPNNGVNLVIVQDQDGTVDSKSYNATSCPDGVGMVSTGTNWAGSNLMYSGGAKNDAGAVTKQTSIDINEIYFATVGGTKLKLASGKLPDCE